jgi:catechol 2,3-dioxygenase-like lactoylglutathione lyase family enzyme
MDPLECIAFSHLHILVRDLDEAAEFYREVMGFVEMQSHDNLANRGLAAYYGITENPENFRISLRFLALPGVFTIKLLKRETGSYGAVQQQQSASYEDIGLGPVSLVLKDLEKSYQHFEKYARVYSSKYKIRLLSKPVFLSPILPHQIGATRHSAFFEQREILADLERKFAQRAKFQMVDPFGVRWEFNNNIDFIAAAS